MKFGQGEFFKTFVAYVYRGFACVYACVCRGQKRALRSPGPGVTDSCELPRECWKSNSGPLEEQSVLLIGEPSRPPQESYF